MDAKSLSLKDFGHATNVDAHHADLNMSPVGAANPEQGAPEHVLVLSDAPAPSMPTLQCPVCKRELCQTHDLCFFYRRNPQNGVEVHLILRPEVPVPQTLVQAPEADKGATQSWRCACGAKIGDTRPVGPNKALMTAFKSSSVMLYGQHHTGKKSMWPRIYNTSLFNNIVVRFRDTFHGL